ncbi:HK97 family phage prohead protease [Streptosporangium sp. NBC_01495]|uniref:HK97 family phage prohead protease n=1 Tax=Streptosporangium sp. NBC_01495 TaxID=2903899 RepID=UPI002E34B76F|nr:HK97 family phage prohead protease [Streptosporangium sp. NBC_01495]
MKTLRDLDVVRASTGMVRLTRADGADDWAPVMVVRFSPFNTWYEINSYWEGRFLERTERGAFAKTMSEQGSRVKVLFNHGADPQIGDKVLGLPQDLREDQDAAAGDVPLLDTSYNRDLLPGIEAGAYGSSFMFRVIQDAWNDEPGRSDHNPEGLPERTIKEVRLFEFGPVTWPANLEATSGIRSGTDDFYARLRDRDPKRVDELEQRIQRLRTPLVEQPPPGTAPDLGAAPDRTDELVSHHSGGLTPRERRWRRYPYLKEGASR